MSEEKTDLSIEKDLFGTQDNGEEVYIFTLRNSHGLEVKVSTFGGIITSILSPDREGKLEDIVLGFDNLKDYQKEHPYFGAIVGRCANRIGKGSFSLDGKEYQLARNVGENHLHGGLKGFDKVVWEASVNEGKGIPVLSLTYLSADMEEGYPGNFGVVCEYSLNDSDELHIDFYATTDKATVLNLTNHSYFNLSAGRVNDCLDHIVKIYADHFTAVDKDSIPTGELRLVENTPMDLREGRRIGDGIDSDYEAIHFGNGRRTILSVNYAELGVIHRPSERSP